MRREEFLQYIDREYPKSFPHRAILLQQEQKERDLAIIVPYC